jgi:hypothetical protein
MLFRFESNPALVLRGAFAGAIDDELFAVV